jgi:hypothetical protein
VTPQIRGAQIALAEFQAVSLIGDLGGGWSHAQLHDPLQPNKRTPANETP